MTTPNDTEPPKELTQPTQEETSQLNINVSPCLTAKEYRKNLCRLLDDHLVGVENLLKEKVPLGDRREQALRPYQTASDQLKAEIDNLPLYAIIPDSLHSCLVNAKLLQTEKLERALNYLEKLHEAFGEFKALTATDTSLDAQKEIIKSLETIERFCERYNISQGDWHQKLEEVISENARLKAENDDLKVNFHLQDIQMDEEEENDLLLTDAEKRESTRFGFLDHVEYGGETDLFQSIAPPPRVPTNRLSSQHPQASITTARNPSEIANNFGPGSYTHSQPPLNTSEWYFKSQALPPLEKFRGLSERSLDEFLESFDSKYPPMLFNDSERRNAFVRLLKDNAERAYKSLDDVSQRGSLASIVAKMRRFLARDNQVTSLDATRQIEHLKLIPEQLTQFCDRLEQLTRQAYPSMPHDDLSFMRAEQLYRRITHWNNSIEALRILESTPRTTVYACLKKFVFQLERSRQHHMNLNNANRLGKSQRRPQPQMSTMPNSNDENHRPRNIVESLPVVASCYECGQDGHYRRNCPRIRNMSNPPNGRNQGRPPAQPQPSNMRNQQSFSNNRGNQQSNPMNQNNRQNNFGSNSQGRNDRAPAIHSIDGRQDDAKPPTTAFMSNEKPLFALDHSSDRVNVNSLINVASTVNSLVVNDLVYFGEKPMYEVKIGDLRGPALLDSGAQPSTMTLCTYRQIIETLPDPEKYLKLLDPPPGKTQPIYNASGVEMAIKGIVLMQVRLLATQKESSVVFHIITDKPTDGPRELILGTNAFKALGVKLAFDAPTPTFPQVTTSMENPVQSTATETHEIVVAKRIEIFPSEARWIPLEMKNFESFSGREAIISSPAKVSGREFFDQVICRFDEKGSCRILLTNKSPQLMVLARGQMIGQATTAKNVYSISALQIPEVIECLKVEGESTKGNVVDKESRLVDIVNENHTEAVPPEIIDILKDFKDYFAIDEKELRANTVADALSRGIAPPPPESDDETKICEELGNVVVASVQCNESWLTELREEETYRLLIEVLLENASSESQAETNRRRPTKATPNILLKEGNHKLTISDFCIEEGFLWLCIDGEQPRRVVPLSQRLALFEEVHAGTYAGHFSPLKICRLLKKNYFWANMSKDIHTWHRRCAKCFLTNVNDKLTPPLHPISTSRPYELVGVDLMELGLTTTGNKYVLVLIDHFSKWLGAYPIPGKSADIVARTISTRWLGEGRWPEKFISDQGPEFLNEILDVLRKLTKIQWTVTKGYNPRENGVTERVNKTLQRCLRKLVDHPGEWDNFLPFVTSAYNCTSHSTTGESPFFILHGFDPKFPIGSNIPERTAYQEIDYSQYKECLVDIIREAHNIVKERTSQEMERCKEFYDRKNKVDSKRYPIVGDRVFVRLPPSRTGEKFPKLVFDVKGPYRVIETSANSALLTLIYGNEEPIRIQFDLILVVPPGLEIPEHNPKRRRKAVPKHLGFTGTLTDRGTIVAQINTSFSRPNTDMKNILPSDAGHPHFLCSGTIDNNRRVILCNISTCTMKDLADIVTYTIPESCYEKPVTTVGAIAQVLAVLEAHSIHPKLKEQMILEGTTCPISTDTWIRGFHIGMLQCHHIRQFFEEHQGEAVAITKNAFLPPSGITDREMTLVARNIFDPPVKPPKTDDLMLFPEQRLYEKISELVLTQGVVTPYQDHTDIVGTLFKQPKLRQVLIFLKTQEKPEELDILLRQTQKAAEVTDTRILIAMPPVTKTTEHWIEFYFNWKKIYQNFIEELAEQNAIPRIYKLDVEEVGPLHHSTPWSLLGYQLNNLTPQGQLSVKQLDAFLDAIKKTDKDQDVKLRIHVHRKQTRQMPATRQAAPPSHQQNRRRHLGPNPNEPANRRFPAMQQQDNLHHGHNHQMYQQRRPPTPADPYRRHTQHHNQSRRVESPIRGRGLSHGRRP